MAIRVLTWNVWWRFDDWRERLSGIRSVLLESGPDICGLQEVWADGNENLAAELAARLGMDWTWLASPHPEPWRRRAREPTALVGNAILTRWPIVARAELALPDGHGGAEGRVALLAVIETPWGRLPFATTQLTSAPSESAVRGRQVRTLTRLLSQHAAEDFPVVLTGDMNAEPDSDEMRLLGGHKTAPSEPGFLLVDAWRYADPTLTPWTWDRANPHVRATMEPSARIDYILVGPPRSDGRGHVLSIRRIGNAPVRGIWPSDHAGLVADLATARADRRHLGGRERAYATPRFTHGSS